MSDNDYYDPARDVDEVLCTSRTQSVRPEIENGPLGLLITPLGLEADGANRTPTPGSRYFFVTRPPSAARGWVKEQRGEGVREGLALKLEGAAAIDVVAPRTRPRSNERCAAAAGESPAPRGPGREKACG